MTTPPKKKRYFGGMQEAEGEFPALGARTTPSRTSSAEFPVLGARTTPSRTIRGAITDPEAKANRPPTSDRPSAGERRNVFEFGGAPTPGNPPTQVRRIDDVDDSISQAARNLPAKRFAPSLSDINANEGAPGVASAPGKLRKFFPDLPEEYSTGLELQPGQDPDFSSSPRKGEGKARAASMKGISKRMGEQAGDRYTAPAGQEPIGDVMYEGLSSGAIPNYNPNAPLGMQPPNSPEALEGRAQMSRGATLNLGMNQEPQSAAGLMGNIVGNMATTGAMAPGVSQTVSAAAGGEKALTALNYARRIRATNAATGAVMGGSIAGAQELARSTAKGDDYRWSRPATGTLTGAAGGAVINPAASMGRNIVASTAVGMGGAGAEGLIEGLPKREIGMNMLLAGATNLAMAPEMADIGPIPKARQQYESPIGPYKPKSTMYDQPIGPGEPNLTSDPWMVARPRADRSAPRQIQRKTYFGMDDEPFSPKGQTGEIPANTTQEMPLSGQDPRAGVTGELDSPFPKRQTPAGPPRPTQEIPRQRKYFQTGEYGDTQEIPAEGQLSGERLSKQQQQSLAVNEPNLEENKGLWATLEMPAGDPASDGPLSEQQRWSALANEPNTAGSRVGRPVSPERMLEMGVEPVPQEPTGPSNLTLFRGDPTLEDVKMSRAPYAPGKEPPKPPKPEGRFPTGEQQRTPTGELPQARPEDLPGTLSKKDQFWAIFRTLPKDTQNRLVNDPRFPNRFSRGAPSDRLIDDLLKKWPELSPSERAAYPKELGEIMDRLPTEKTGYGETDEQARARRQKNLEDFPALAANRREVLGSRSEAGDWQSSGKPEREMRAFFERTPEDQLTPAQLNQKRALEAGDAVAAKKAEVASSEAGRAVLKENRRIAASHIASQYTKEEFVAAMQNVLKNYGSPAARQVDLWLRRIGGAEVWKGHTQEGGRAPKPRINQRSLEALYDTAGKEKIETPLGLAQLGKALKALPSEPGPAPPESKPKMGRPPKPKGEKSEGQSSTGATKTPTSSGQSAESGSGPIPASKARGASVPAPRLTGKRKVAEPDKPGAGTRPESDAGKPAGGIEELPGSAESKGGSPRVGREKGATTAGTTKEPGAGPDYDKEYAPGIKIGSKVNWKGSKETGLVIGPAFDWQNKPIPGHVTIRWNKAEFPKAISDLTPTKGVAGPRGSDGPPATMELDDVVRAKVNGRNVSGRVAEIRGDKIGIQTDRGYQEVNKSDIEFHSRTDPTKKKAEIRTKVKPQDEGQKNANEKIVADETPQKRSLLKDFIKDEGGWVANPLARRSRSKAKATRLEPIIEEIRQEGIAKEREKGMTEVASEYIRTNRFWAGTAQRNVASSAAYFGAKELGRTFGAPIDWIYSTATGRDRKYIGPNPLTWFKSMGKGIFGEGFKSAYSIAALGEQPQFELNRYKGWDGTRQDIAATLPANNKDLKLLDRLHKKEMLERGFSESEWDRYSRKRALSAALVKKGINPNSPEGEYAIRRLWLMDHTNPGPPPKTKLGRLMRFGKNIVSSYTSIASNTIIGASEQPMRVAALTRGMEEYAKLASRNKKGAFNLFMDAMQTRWAGGRVTDAQGNVNHQLERDADTMLALAMADADVITFANENPFAKGTQFAKDWLFTKKEGENFAVTGTKRTLGVLLDQTVPYPKANTNVANVILDHVPGVGLLTEGTYGIGETISAAQTAKKAGLKNVWLDAFDRKTRRRFAEMAGSQGVGAALVALGYWMSENDILADYIPYMEFSNEEKGKFFAYQAARRPQGSVYLGSAIGRVPVEMFQPLASPLFLGSELYRMQNGENTTNSLWRDYVQSLNSQRGIEATLFQQPMLEGPRSMAADLFKESKDTTFASRAAGTAAGIVADVVPKPAQVAAKALDTKGGREVQREPEKENRNIAQHFWDRFKMNLPGARQTVEEKTDAFGKTVTKDSGPIDTLLGLETRERTDPLYRELIKNEIPLEKPKREEGESNEAYHKRLVEEGEVYEYHLRNMVDDPGYSAVEGNETFKLSKKKVIQQMFQRAKEDARSGDVTYKSGNLRKDKGALYYYQQVMKAANEEYKLQQQKEAGAPSEKERKQQKVLQEKRGRGIVYE